jgi:predicted nuclease of predicted toxin-antitoxin system
VKLLLDDHYPLLIAKGSRERGHDVVAASEQGWHEAEDESLLALCVDDQRAILTNNVKDFAGIAHRWAMQGRSHHGMVFTSDSSRPRGRNAVGRYVDDLHALLATHQEIDGFVDRIHWL